MIDIILIRNMFKNLENLCDLDNSHIHRCCGVALMVVYLNVYVCLLKYKF